MKPMSMNYVWTWNRIEPNMKALMKTKTLFAHVYDGVCWEVARSSTSMAGQKNRALQIPLLLKKKKKKKKTYMAAAHYSVRAALNLRLWYSILTDRPVFKYNFKYMGILFHTKIQQWARVGIILISIEELQITDNGWNTQSWKTLTSGINKSTFRLYCLLTPWRRQWCRNVGWLTPPLSAINRH